MGFSKGQEEAYNAIMSGENVFLTGEAGTGKSFVIKKFIEKNGRDDNFFVCRVAETDGRTKPLKIIDH